MPAETMWRAMALPSNLGRPSATITRKRLPALAASEKTVRSRDELQIEQTINLDKYRVLLKLLS